MLKRPESWLVVLGLLGALFFFLSQSPQEQAHSIEKKQPSQASKNTALPVTKRIAPQGTPEKKTVAVAPKPSPKPTPKKDLDYMKRNGLLGMESGFVAGVFDSPYWVKLEENLFEHENGSTVEIGLEAGKVIRAHFTFSPDLASAAMQNVLDGILGYETNSPLHLEDLAVGQTPVSGEYTDKEGRVFMFRGDRNPFKKTDKFTAWLEFERR